MVANTVRGVDSVWGFLDVVFVHFYVYPSDADGTLCFETKKTESAATNSKTLRGND